MSEEEVMQMYIECAEIPCSIIRDKEEQINPIPEKDILVTRTIMRSCLVLVLNVYVFHYLIVVKR